MSQPKNFLVGFPLTPFKKDAFKDIYKSQPEDWLHFAQMEPEMETKIPGTSKGGSGQDHDFVISELIFNRNPSQKPILLLKSYIFDRIWGPRVSLLPKYEI